MTLKLVVASTLAVVTPIHGANAQAMTMVPYGGTTPPPVPQAPPADPEDTPEEIAKDAARDLKDSRFYNRPGATRAEYDAAWQDCRLIARGSRTPSGMIPYYYNPAVISPLAAGIGGGIGGMIGAAIAEGQQRRMNRRNCLMIRGWRLVETPAAETARVAALTDEQRSAYFDTIVGARNVAGEVTERTSFTQITDANLALDAPVTGASGVFTGKKADAAAPIALAANEGAIVFAFRRPDAGSAGRSATIAFSRYDVAQRDLIYRPKGWKKAGDKITYNNLASSRDRKLGYEVQVVPLTAGDYVITGTSVGKVPVTSGLCFGAPTFHVNPGDIVYVGDFVPYIDARLSNGEKASGVFYSSHIDDARRTLTTKQPALAARLQPATLRNQATFACSAIVMDRWDLPGVEPLAAPTPTPAVATGEAPAISTQAPVTP